jgi:hypothetical protein
VFHVDPTLPFLPVTRDRVVELVESLNQPQISIPGKAPQEARGYLCGMRNTDGSFSMFVSLFLRQAGHNVVYPHDPREFAIGDYPAAQAEGLQFLESMGFMLDNLNFRKLAPAQQELLLQHVPLFSPPGRAPAPRPADGGAACRAALARFLSSF